MKKSVFYLAALVLIAASCAKEVDITPAETIQDDALVAYSFSAKTEKTKGEI